jgi:exosortase B
MDTTTTTKTATEGLPALKASWMWLGVALALLAAFGPLYWESAGGIWQRDEHAHGPIILVLACYLAWQQLAKLDVQPPRGAEKGGAWAVLALGLLAFLLGRMLSFSVLTFASQPVVAAGAIALIGGVRAVRVLWFPLFFLLFTIPLPGLFVDMVTGALKQWVSVLAEHLLVLMRYPVGRSGVMLVVGPYQMLVADACSGLHSMFTLAAMGMLLMYLRQRASVLHNVLMLLAILPVAFAANIIRVIILVLITYHLGDEAGQGFLHGAAGIVLTVAALLLFILLDLILYRVFGRRQALRA